MSHGASCAAETLWADRGGRQAKTTLRLPFALSFAEAYSAASTLTSLMAAISDAVPISITLRWQYREDNPDEPGVLSNVGRYLCLYYSNDVDIEPIFVPSPNPTYLETTGNFAGIRLDLSSPEVVALANALSEALAGILAPDDVPWNRWLVGGGRTL